MVYGREAVLPIETKYSTWRTIGWNEVHTREELLLARMRQIEMRDEDIQESMLRKTRKRQQGQEYYDRTHNIRKTPLQVKDLVLRHDTFTAEVDKSSSTKLNWRWLGPYKISKADTLKGTYWLSELDGTELAGTFAGNRLKKFVQRDRYFYGADEEENARSLEDAEEVKDRSQREQIKRRAGQGENTERNILDVEQNAEGLEEDFHTTQEVERGTGIIVRVPGLSQHERSKYVRFEEDWNSDGGSSGDGG
jgi:hypothetical protein